MNIFKYLYNRSQCKENKNEIESSSSCTQYVFRYRASPKLRHQQMFFITYSVCLNSFSVPEIFLVARFNIHTLSLKISLALTFNFHITFYVHIPLYPEIIHKHLPCRLTAIVSKLIRPRRILCLFFGSGCSNQQNTQLQSRRKI